MRISELSELTAIPVPRIKYYIREGLLARGVADRATRAEYDDGHVRRLRLIRALVTIGGMSVARARVVLDEIDAPQRETMDLLDLIFWSLARPVTARDDASWNEAAARIDAVTAKRGWQLPPGDPARLAITEAMATMIELGHSDMLDHLDVYAEAAEQVAAADLASIADAEDLASVLERSVIGSLLGETFLTGLRRIAHGQVAGRMTEAGTAPFDA